MLSPRQSLVDQLVAERYAAVYREPARAAAEDSRAADSPEVVAERQRVLNQALDGTHLVAVDVQEAAA